MSFILCSLFVFIWETVTQKCRLRLKFTFESKKELLSYCIAIGMIHTNTQFLIFFFSLSFNPFKLWFLKSSFRSFVQSFPLLSFYTHPFFFTLIVTCCFFFFLCPVFRKKGDKSNYNKQINNCGVFYSVSFFFFFVMLYGCWINILPFGVFRLWWYTWCVVSLKQVTHICFIIFVRNIFLIPRSFCCIYDKMLCYFAVRQTLSFLIYNKKKEYQNNTDTDTDAASAAAAAATKCSIDNTWCQFISTNNSLLHCIRMRKYETRSTWIIMGNETVDKKNRENQ